MLEINPQLQLTVLPVGVEETPVIVIDDVLTDTSILKRFATESAHFDKDNLTAYPGVRAQLPRAYTVCMMAYLGPLFRQTYQIPDNLHAQPIMEYYSLLTTPVDQLQRLQRAPHYDSTKDHYFALVHYLNDGEFGGTGFFRHRPTGFERMYESRLPEFYAAAQAHVEQHGEPGLKYINESDNHFELLHSIDYKPNRLVAYPGNLLHSGLVTPQVDISDSAASGRLTGNLFMDYR